MVKTFVSGFLITLVILGISFFILFHLIPPHNLGEFFKKINYYYLGLSLIFVFFFHLCDTLRIWIISRSMEIRYSLVYGYFISLVSTFGATITPGHIGGDLLPFYTIRRVTNAPSYKIMSVITLKSISGFSFFLLFSPVTIKEILTHPSQAKKIFGIFFLILLVSLLVYYVWNLIYRNTSIKNFSFFKKIKILLFKYFVTCKIFFKKNKIIFFLSIFLSLGMYLSFAFVGAFLVKALSPNVSLKRVLFFELPLIYAIFFSPTPGGSGVGELGALPVFKFFIPQKFLSLFVLLWRFLTQYMSATIGGIILFLLIFVDLKKTRSFLK